MKRTRACRNLVALAVAVVVTSGSSRGAEYSQDFDLPDGTTDMGGETVLVGNVNFTPSVQGNRLQLTEASNSISSSFHIPALASSSEGFLVRFDFQISDVAGGNPPADGFSFSYGPIVFGGTSARAEEGWPGVQNVLSFEVDTWRVGDLEVGPAIGLNRPANVGALGNSEHPSSLARRNGDILTDGTTVIGTAMISWAPDVGASFRTTGLLTNADFVCIPTPGFSGDDTYTFALATRTAGANEALWIDNLTIVTGRVDTDGDGLPDLYEAPNGLDPLDPTGGNGAGGDPDGDGIPNSEELARGLHPWNDDTDSDGLTDTVETNTGTYVNALDTGSDPANFNTDGDSLDDGLELMVGRNPNIPDDPVPSRTYSQDFNAFANGLTFFGDGSSLVGNPNFTPSAQSGTLQLTENSTGNNSALHIPALLNSSEGFTASFDFQMYDPAGGNPPADGFSFSYGNIPFGDFSAQPEEGWPGESPVLSFEVDTWRVGDTEVGPAIGLDRPAGVAGLGNSGHSSSLAHLNGDIFGDGEFAIGTATISWDPEAGASFTTTGLTTNANFSDVPTPGFTGDDSYTFAIAARTGGASESLFIDNIVITTSAGFVLQFDLESSGSDLIFTWRSRAGKVYDILSQVNPRRALSKWEVFSGGIAATPDTNSRTLARPPEPEMYFLVVEREGP